MPDIQPKVDPAIRLACAIIKKFEGLRLKAYPDAHGRWAIGFGDTVGVKEGDVITETEAIARLSERLAPLLKLVAPFSASVRGALLSFGYNAGIESLEHVLEGESRLEDYVTSQGKILAGLQERREFEAAIVAAAEDGNGLFYPSLALRRQS